MSKEGAQPRVSVVIIGRDEGHRLERCLSSVRVLLSSAWPVEVIYVDSNSTDGSAQEARQAGARVIELASDRPTPALARDAGWRSASAPFILFLDGDTVLHPEFVANASPHFDDPNVVVVWGRLQEMNPGASLFNRIFDLHWPNPAPGPTDTFCGNAMVRRSALEAVGGFDKDLVAEEEAEICRRLRKLAYVILYIDRPMAEHDLAMTRLSQYWRRFVRTGYARADLVSRYRDTDPSFVLPRVRGTLVWGSALALLPVGGIIMSVSLNSVLPLALAACIWLFLVFRTALQYRRKKRGWPLRILYGIHWHLRRLPILWGHLIYITDRRLGYTGRRIEHKR